MSEPETAAAFTPPPGRRPLGRALLWGGVIGLLLAVGIETAWVAFGRNVHVVVPGRIFRSAQPRAEDLAKLVQRHGIRTVINLRGCGAPYSWYMDEARSTHDLGLNQEDICLSAYRLPSVSEIRRLVEVLDRTEYPVLLHCRRGADRTGLVAVVCLLLYTDEGPAWALRHMKPRYGHIAVGQTANLDLFFKQYQEWLQQTAQAHSPAAFRRWILNEYRSSPFSARVELLEVPDVVPRNEPWAMRVRFHNTSGKPWRLSAANTAGVHAAYLLTDERGRALAHGRAGLYDGEVLPDRHLDVTLDLPAVAQPGPWFLTVNLHHDQLGWFHQFGSEPLHIRLATCAPGQSSGCP